MSLKSILKRMFNIETEGVYRTFRILGVPCKYKSPKLRLLLKIETVSKQNDTALESRLRKEFEAKINKLQKLLDEKLQNTTNDFNARNFLLQKTVSENLEFPVSHLSAFVLGNAGDNILVDA